MLIEKQRRVRLGLKQSVLLFLLMMVTVFGQGVDGESAISTDPEPVVWKEITDSSRNITQEFDITTQQKEPPLIKNDNLFGRNRSQADINKEIQAGIDKANYEKEMAEKRLEKERKKKNAKIEKLKAEGDFEKAAALEKERDEHDAAVEQSIADNKQRQADKVQKRKEE